jgi:hypothetical protein
VQEMGGEFKEKVHRKRITTLRLTP